MPQIDLNQPLGALRASVEEQHRQALQQFEQEYGRLPTQDELTQQWKLQFGTQAATGLHQIVNPPTTPKTPGKTGCIDHDKTHVAHSNERNKLTQWIQKFTSCAPTLDPATEEHLLDHLAAIADQLLTKGSTALRLLPNGRYPVSQPRTDTHAERRRQVLATLAIRGYKAIAADFSSGEGAA